MDARKFNGDAMPSVHESWMARILNMRVNPHNGPDLIDDNKCVEVKFRLNTPRNPNGWTVQDHQLDYEFETRYWALGRYDLAVSVSSIKTKNPARLEEKVSFREVWIVEYHWMNQFPKSICQGEGKDGVPWKNIFRYPKQSVLPRSYHTSTIKKGFIHLTEGVDKNDFSYLLNKNK